MRLFIVALGVATVVAALAFSGCSLTPKPLDYPPDNELKKGPGILSGEEGAFTIYRKPVADGKPAPGTGDAGQTRD